MKSPANTTPRLVAIELTALLLLAPLPLACVPATPRAWLTAALLGFAATLAFTNRRLLERWRLPPGGTALLAFAAWGFAQVVLAPPVVTASGAALLPERVDAAISAVPARTASRSREVLAGVLLFCLAGAVWRGVARASALAAGLVVLATALSAYGILVTGGAVPPVDAGQVRDVVSATYFNRNHFAGLLELALLTGAGLFTARQAAHRGGDPHHLPLQLALLAGLFLCAAALLMTHSRGGVVATSVGAVAFTVLIARHRGSRPARRWWLALGAVAIVVAASAPRALVERFGGTAAEWADAGTRPDIWLSGAALLAAFPWFGTGLGTYADVSPLTQATAIGGRIEHAHSDPLEFMVETGAVGAVLLLLAALTFWIHLWRRLPRVADPAVAYLVCGMAAGLLAMAAHGLVDFNLQIPANALWCAALAGTTAGLLRGDAPIRRERAWSQRLGTMTTAVAGCAAAVGAWFAIAEGSAAALTDGGRYALANRIHPRAGEGFLAAAEHAAQEGVPAPIRAAAEAALRHNPLSPTAHRLLGRAALHADAGVADAAFRRSLQLTNPHDRPSHQLGVARAHIAAGELGRGLQWCHDLLRRNPQLAGEVLDELYRSIPAYEVVRLAVPDSAPVRRQWIEVLTRHGDFAGREQELATLHGHEIAAGQVTLTDGIVLRSADMQAKPDPRGQRIAVDLALTTDRARYSPPAPPALPPHAWLRFDGPGAAGARRVFLDQPRAAWTFVADHSFPPGRYAVTLTFTRDAPPLPIGAFTVEDRVLAMTHAAPVTAARWHWFAADPLRRHTPDPGVPLRPGDRLERAVRTKGPGELLVRCAAPSTLTAQLDGQPVPPRDAGLATHHRFALPALDGQRLAILPGHDEPIVLDCTFFAERP